MLSGSGVKMGVGMIKYKKGEGMTMQKILVLVVVILVLIAVIYFLNRGNLTQWVKNLPGYSSGEDKDVDVTQTSDTARAISCTEKIGRTRSATGFWTRSRNSISIFDDNLVLQPQKDIYWYVGLKTIEDTNGNDKVLGTVTQVGGNYKVSLNSLGMSYPQVSKLNDAYLIAGTNEICKMGTK